MAKIKLNREQLKTAVYGAWLVEKTPLKIFTNLENSSIESPPGRSVIYNWCKEFLSGTFKVSG